MQQLPWVSWRNVGIGVGVGLGIGVSVGVGLGTGVSVGVGLGGKDGLGVGGTRVGTGVAVGGSASWDACELRGAALSGSTAIPEPGAGFTETGCVAQPVATSMASKAQAQRALIVFKDLGVSASISRDPNRASILNMWDTSAPSGLAARDGRSRSEAGHLPLSLAGRPGIATCVDHLDRAQSQG